jgi:Tfp pilus assembly protein PilF
VWHELRHDSLYVRTDTCPLSWPGSKRFFRVSSQQLVQIDVVSHGLAFLAEAYAADNKPDLAHRTFDDALRTTNETGERWTEPEIHRMFGDFLTCRGSTAVAIASYEQAITIARGQASRSFELRATTSLARVLSDRDGHTEARDRLLNIYRSFDAGCNAADLADAKALLDELPSAS